MCFKGQWRVGDRRLCVERVQDKIVVPSITVDNNYNGRLTPEKKVGEALIV